MQFRDWLSSELEQRGWTAAELAKRASINPSTLSRILDDKEPRPVGVEVARKIALGLGEAPEKVFILAGLLPAPLGEDDPTVHEITNLVKQLPESKRREVLEFTRFKATTMLAV
jgi:transcriptional regulator with XRE-family HTH domain